MLFGPGATPTTTTRSGSSTGPSTPASTSSTRPTCTAGGESEEIVGKALRGRRDDVVLATKFHGPMGDDRNRRGTSRRWIVRAVEDSLRRLGTDWIDLYQVHRPEPDVDIDETLGALTDLVRAGKVRYLGSSTFPAHAIVEAQWTAQRRGRERFVCEQPPYSMLVRGIEADVLPVCERHGDGRDLLEPAGRRLAVGPRRPDEAGQQPRRAHPGPVRHDPGREPGQARGGQLARRRRGRRGPRADPPGARVRLNHPAVTAAIIGCRTMEQLESQLGAADVDLDPAVLDRIDEIVPPGTNLNPADAGWIPPSLSDPARRRR